MCYNEYTTLKNNQTPYLRGFFFRQALTSFFMKPVFYSLFSMLFFELKIIKGFYVNR